MPLYRVTFTTSLLVDASSEGEANKIARRNLGEEISNGFSSVHGTELLTDIDQLEQAERYSLPWRDPARDRAGEPERDVNQILGEV